MLSSSSSGHSDHRPQWHAQKRGASAAGGKSAQAAEHSAPWVDASADQQIKWAGGPRQPLLLSTGAQALAHARGLCKQQLG